jgi:hypothetical protein
MMTEKFGIPRHAPRAGPPETYLQATAGLSDISVLSKCRYGRSFSLGKVVIWRMSDLARKGREHGFRLSGPRVSAGVACRGA